MNETEHIDQTEQPIDPSPDAAPAPGGRAWMLVILVVVLLAYPAARWALNRRTPAPAGTPAANAAKAGASLQASLEAYQAGRYQDAITAAQAVLAINPDTAEAYNNIAVSNLGLKKYDEAIAAAQQALRVKPDMQLAKNNLAWIQQEKAKASRPAVAPEVTAKVGQLLNQSLEHTKTRQYKECVSEARQATALDPFAAAAFNNLGFCQALLGQWDDGIKSVQTAISLDGTLQLAKNNLAWMQQEKAKAGKQ